MKNEYRQILSKMFGGEIPGFITEAGQNFLKIRLQGEGIRTIRLQDVLEFLEQKPGDGMKMFAGVLFDSKQAYFLAIMFHEYFKAVQMGG